MGSPSELLLLHGFEGADFSHRPHELSEEVAFHNAGVCRFSHGYADPWESEPQRSWAWQPAQAKEPATFLELEHPELGSAAAESDDVVHGEEASAWASAGRRALLQRMAED